ncbi:C40 family peptidase [Roseococcus suduntuyensis]|uniref:Uncharacterized protein n=1 Tax=Roseococcus suduntuyensis TaxID=455361 RepID=A0A840ABN8_9PROT|nr:hypothetical protein [Roseococcus suduntuyensis]MBB3898302.1 hypothetical protein [Roseococcus suduntuyensis]
MARHLRAPDLYRGDIILTSMRTRLGPTTSVTTALIPVVENNFINVATVSAYSHAILVAEPGRIIEFRKTMKEKSLRDSLTDGGRDVPAVAHVFRRRGSNGHNRPQVLINARKMVHGFRAVDPQYVLSVWMGLNRLNSGLRQEDVQGMLVCSSFCAAAWASVGLPLSPDDPHNMSPGDIALCADPATMKSVARAQDLWALAVTAARQRPASLLSSRHITLDLVGMMDPAEYS